jgi:hypothetical protein
MTHSLHCCCAPGTSPRLHSVCQLLTTSNLQHDLVGFIHLTHLMSGVYSNPNHNKQLCECDQYHPSPNKQLCECDQYHPSTFHHSMPTPPQISALAIAHTAPWTNTSCGCKYPPDCAYTTA